MISWIFLRYQFCTLNLKSHFFGFQKVRFSSFSALVVWGCMQWDPVPTLHHNQLHHLDQHLHLIQPKPNTSLSAFTAWRLSRESYWIAFLYLELELDVFESPYLNPSIDIKHWSRATRVPVFKQTITTLLTFRNKTFIMCAHRPLVVTALSSNSNLWHIILLSNLITYTPPHSYSITRNRSSLCVAWVPCRDYAIW